MDNPLNEESNDIGEEMESQSIKLMDESYGRGGTVQFLQKTVQFLQKSVQFLQKTVQLLQFLG